MGGEAGQGTADNAFGKQVRKDKVVADNEQKKAEALKADQEKAQRVQEKVDGGMSLAEAQASEGFGSKDVSGSLEKQAGRDATAENQQLNREATAENQRLSREAADRRARLTRELQRDLAEVKNKEKIDTIDATTLDEKSRKYRTDVNTLQKDLALYEKDTEEYDQIQELLKESKKLAKQYTIAGQQAKLRGVRKEDQGELLVEAGQQGEHDEAEALIQKFESGGFRGGANWINPWSWVSTNDDKRRFEAKYEEKYGQPPTYNEKGEISTEVPKGNFEQFNQPQPQQESPRIQAAKKALQDPNAPEAVKEQARKILGL